MKTKVGIKCEANVTRSNTVIAVNGIMCYLNISKEEAIQRYKNSGFYHSDMDKEPEVKVLTFNDQFELDMLWR